MYKGLARAISLGLRQTKRAKMMTVEQDHEQMDSDNQWMQEKFEKAVDMLKDLPKDGSVSPSNDDKLCLYALYKQATEGACNSGKPAFYDVVGRAKWDAWRKLGSMGKYEAMEEYIVASVEILNKYAEHPLAAELVHNLETMIYDDDRSSPMAASPSPGLYEAVVEELGSPLASPKLLEPSELPYQPVLSHPSAFPDGELAESESRAPSRFAAIPTAGSPQLKAKRSTLTGGLRTGSFMTPIPAHAIAASGGLANDLASLAPTATKRDSSETSVSKMPRVDELVKAIVNRLRDLEVRVANMAVTPKNSAQAFIRSDHHFKSLKGSAAIVSALKAQSRHYLRRIFQAILFTVFLVFVFGFKRNRWPLRLVGVRRKAILYLLGN